MEKCLFVSLSVAISSALFLVFFSAEVAGLRGDEVVAGQS
jgi:hypothetical protein